MFRPITTSVFALLLMASSNVAAQQVGLPEGSRVRVTFNNSPTTLVGTSTAISESGLVLDIGAEQIFVPLTDIERLERSLGRKRNAKKGLLFGSVVGLIAGALVAPGEEVDESNPFCTSDIPECVTGYSRAVGALSGLLTGAALGAGVGLLVNTDEWAEVTLTPSSLTLRIPLF